MRHPAGSLGSPAILAAPNVVTQVKSADSDGYAAIQIGSGARRASLVNKAQKGAWKELGSFRSVKEFRIGDASAFLAGIAWDRAAGADLG